MHMIHKTWIPKGACIGPQASYAHSPTWSPFITVLAQVHRSTEGRGRHAEALSTHPWQPEAPRHGIHRALGFLVGVFGAPINSLVERWWGLVYQSLPMAFFGTIFQEHISSFWLACAMLGSPSRRWNLMLGSDFGLLTHFIMHVIGT